MAKKNSRSLNASSTFAQLTKFIKKYANAPGDLDELIKDLLMESNYTLSKLFKFKYQREKDVHVHELKRLSCYRLTHSEVLRSPAFQVFTEEELLSFKHEAFLNPIRTFLSILAHHKISNVTSWHLEQTKLPSPRILVNCNVTFPGPKFAKYRIDVARLSFPVWQHQHIFYSRKNYVTRQSKDYDYYVVQQDGSVKHSTASHSTSFPKVGAGAPMCLQQLKIKHKYKGNLNGIDVDIVLQGIGQSEPHLYNLRYFHDYKLQKIAYSHFMQNTCG